jgi:hypothetical protein
MKTDSRKYGIGEGEVGIITQRATDGMNKGRLFEVVKGPVREFYEVGHNIAIQTISSRLTFSYGRLMILRSTQQSINHHCALVGAKLA